MGQVFIGSDADTALFLLDFMMCIELSGAEIATHFEHLGNNVQQHFFFLDNSVSGEFVLWNMTQTEWNRTEKSTNGHEKGLSHLFLVDLKRFGWIRGVR